MLKGEVIVQDGYFAQLKMFWSQVSHGGKIIYASARCAICSETHDGVQLTKISEFMRRHADVHWN